MDDKLKVFWNLDILVKMCRSKSDGPALRVEEEEIEEKCAGYKQEIEDIKSQLEEESYDTSAEMADRNIEIITKKLLKTLKANLKEKNQALEVLKEKESDFYKDTSVLRETKNSFENYILSMEERVNETIDHEIIDRYNLLIEEAKSKIVDISGEIEESNQSYNNVQDEILTLSEEIRDLEDQIDKKKRLLEETQRNLEIKDTYIDKTKKEKNVKRIADLESKIEKLNNRLEEIRKDPKYIETRIKDVITNKEDIFNARDYLIQLINIAIKQPYINVPTDNTLEEELLKATQARDAFANEIDQKKYDILESDTPEKIRIDFLKQRIEAWEKELTELKERINVIDKDSQYNYEEKDKRISEMIIDMKKDLLEYQKAYDNTPDGDLGAKASAKVALNEKKDDILAAEKIAQSFKQDESDEISLATHGLKRECEQLTRKIQEAFNEMDDIRSRLLSKKSGALDIALQNKDKEKLKELAQIVVDIKHRRQFAEPPIEIAHRLEEILHLDLSSGIDNEYVEQNSVIVPGDYSAFIKAEPIDEVEMVEVPEGEIIETEESSDDGEKRGIKVIEEVEITNPTMFFDEQDEGTVSELTEKGIESIETNNESTGEINADNIPVEEISSIEEPLEQLDIIKKESTEEVTTEPVEEVTEETTEEVATEPVEEVTEETTEEVATEPVEEVTEETTEEVATEPVEEVTEETTEEVATGPVEEVTEETTEEVATEPVEEVTEETTEEVTAEPVEEVIEGATGEPIREITVEEPLQPIAEAKEEKTAEENPFIELESTKSPGEDLSINSMFKDEKNNPNDEKDDNISEGLLNELDEYINNLGVKES